ncbi:DUF1003 domain-containing protein [Massilia sp. IC2-476]|uniref:DUF1003 domain-containing protein n=1 Tax=Massilia sp. IC2-476 TaxID=2887199 RepID=UPI001D0FD9B8|nr:DUF1003 domain-containing protein [Massilia sp. IC2-476]MCC2972926.1 DUF1003 domain-containing protein [Massilia sp. IC2-476]
MDAPRDHEEAIPSTVHEHVGTVSEFYARHEEQTTPAQRIVEKISIFLGSPAYVAGNLVFVVLWIIWNLAAPELGFDQWDEPPFFWLQGLIALNAFIISTTVLIRQNRMSALANQHAHLDLQVNLLADEKTSKIIEMLEELRRDLPNVRDKVDHKAEELAKPTDTGAVISIIEEASEQLNCKHK